MKHLPLGGAETLGSWKFFEITKGVTMSEIQKLKKEIQSTLDQEKSNIFDGHQDEDNLRGWIEALEYCIREIELIEEIKKGVTNE